MCADDGNAVGSMENLHEMKDLPTKQAVLKMMEVGCEGRLWVSRCSRTFFDVKIFNSLSSDHPRNSEEGHNFPENSTQLKYGARLMEVKNASLSLHAFVGTRGSEPSVTHVMNPIAGKLCG